MKTFVDSSAFAKRYVEEHGSDAVDGYCQEATELALSVLCVPEIISALNRRVREKALDLQQYAQAKQSVSEDVRDVTIVDITEPVVSTCIQILEKNPVREADALHVACAVEWRAELFLSADKRQVSAAKHAGLNARFV